MASGKVAVQVRRGTTWSDVLNSISLIEFSGISNIPQGFRLAMATSWFCSLLWIRQGNASWVPGSAAVVDGLPSRLSGWGGEHFFEDYWMGKTDWMGSLVPTNLSLYIAIRTSYYFGRVFLVLLADVLIIVSWGSCLQWTHQFLVSYFVHSFQRMIVPLDIQGRWGLYRLGLRATSMVKGPKTHLMATLMNIDIDDRLSNLG